MKHKLMHGVTYKLVDADTDMTKWPFSKMELTNIVYFDCSDCEDVRDAIEKVRAYSTSYAQRSGKRFVSKMDKTGIYIRREE